jgi:hypothetical protein
MHKENIAVRYGLRFHAPFEGAVPGMKCGLAARSFCQRCSSVVWDSLVS